MAGHSAWKNIKHRKAAVDRKRGRIWSKLSRALIVAARQGGGDPAFNPTLRLAIDEAKAANMPKDTIEKAVKKGSGAMGGENYVPVRYEAYGPGGVALLVDCLTDNVNRTAPEIRLILDKYGGNLGKPGSVAFSFTQFGLIHIESSKVAEDRLMELVIDAGADDVQDAGGAWEVTCQPTQFARVKEAIEQAGVEPDMAELTFIPSSRSSPDGETAVKVLRLIDALEENDDVQKVYHNAEISDAAVSAMG
jgi:YebC/PmpR family DNA-binding regulatory protein